MYGQAWNKFSFWHFDHISPICLWKPFWDTIPFLIIQTVVTASDLPVVDAAQHPGIVSMAWYSAKRNCYAAAAIVSITSMQTDNKYTTYSNRRCQVHSVVRVCNGYDVWTAFCHSVSSCHRRDVIITSHNDITSDRRQLTLFADTDAWRHSVSTQTQWLIDWVKVLHHTRHKIGHFGDALPSQCLGQYWEHKNQELGEIITKIYTKPRLTKHKNHASKTQKYYDVK